MTDFASKYGFALADSDSDGDSNSKKEGKEHDNDNSAVQTTSAYFAVATSNDDLNEGNVDVSNTASSLFGGADVDTVVNV